MNKSSLTILLIWLLLAQKDWAQNLVPNGDFENYTAIPDSMGQIYLATGWNNVVLNYNYSFLTPYGSPDYYHTLGTNVPTDLGPMTPASGDGQVGFATFEGFIPDYREYLSTQLSAPLVPGQQYTLSFFLSNGMNGFYTKRSNNI